MLLCFECKKWSEVKWLLLLALACMGKDERCVLQCCLQGALEWTLQMESPRVWTHFILRWLCSKQTVLQFKNNIDHCLTFTQPSKLLSLSRTTKTLELIVQDGFKGEGPITSRLALGCLWYVPYLRNQKPITDKFGSLIVLGVVRWSLLFTAPWNQSYKPQEGGVAIVLVNFGNCFRGSAHPKYSSEPVKSGNFNSRTAICDRGLHNKFLAIVVQDDGVVSSERTWRCKRDNVHLRHLRY